MIDRIILETYYKSIMPQDKLDKILATVVYLKDKIDNEMSYQYEQALTEGINEALKLI